MFTSLFGVPPRNEAVKDDSAQSSALPAESADITGPPGLLSIWNVASAVTHSVKARADELVKSVAETNWKTELLAFGNEVKEDTKVLSHKAQEAVEHLPEVVEHLPEQAGTHLANVHLPVEVGSSIEAVSSSLSIFGKSLLSGTKEFIEQLKEGVDSEIATATKEAKRAARAKQSSTSAMSKQATPAAKYSRFDAEVTAMQRDPSTYCDEPDDVQDYTLWRTNFDLAARQADIARVVSDNAFMAELQSRLVPIIVEHEDFWTRYFYRYHKLSVKEEQRQQLALRAKNQTLQVEEDVGWGDDDDPLPAQAAPPSSASTPASFSTDTAAPAGAAALGMPLPDAVDTEATPRDMAKDEASPSAPLPGSSVLTPVPAPPIPTSTSASFSDASASSGTCVAAGTASELEARTSGKEAGAAGSAPQDMRGSPSGSTGSACHVEHEHAAEGDVAAGAETASDRSDWCVVPGPGAASGGHSSPETAPLPPLSSPSTLAPQLSAPDAPAHDVPPSPEQGAAVQAMQPAGPALPCPEPQSMSSSLPTPLAQVQGMSGQLPAAAGTSPSSASGVQSVPKESTSAAGASDARPGAHSVPPEEGQPVPGGTKVTVAAAASSSGDKGGQGRQPPGSGGAAGEDDEDWGSWD